MGTNEKSAPRLCRGRNTVSHSERDELFGGPRCSNFKRRAGDHQRRTSLCDKPASPVCWCRSEYLDFAFANFRNRNLLRCCLFRERSRKRRLFSDEWLSCCLRSLACECAVPPGPIRVTQEIPEPTTAPMHCIAALSVGYASPRQTIGAACYGHGAEHMFHLFECNRAHKPYHRY